MAAIINTHNVIQVGEVIRFHRKAAGLSRVELAKIAGTGKTVVYDIETGKTTVRLNTLLKLLQALNIDLHLSSPLMERFEETQNA